MRWDNSYSIAALGKAVKYLVAKLLESFGRLGDAVESLDDFRDTKACFSKRKMLHGVSRSGRERQPPATKFPLRRHSEVGSMSNPGG